MKLLLKILRRKSAKETAYWQSVPFETDDAGETVATALQQISGDGHFTDTEGRPVGVIRWECSCLQKKCGACAMRINGLPRLACSTFLNSLKSSTITLEPMSKFPLVRDLIVDRSILFDNLKKLNLWLESEAYMIEWTHEQRYQSARCLMCGCCIEVCPNFSPEGDFTGAVAAVNAFRILNEEQETDHHKEISAEYRKRYFEGCGKSLACQNICPAGLPVEELIVRSNAAAIWNR